MFSRPFARGTLANASGIDRSSRGGRTRAASCSLVALLAGCAIAEARGDASRNDRVTFSERTLEDRVEVEPDATIRDGGGLDADASATPSVDADAGRIDVRGAVCGDGRVDPGERCDDGNRIDTDRCRNDCTLARCGDGVVRMGVEECDDGNTAAGDGCSVACVRCAGEGVDDPVTGACYRRDETSSAWDAARDRCAARGQRLASFADRASWDRVEAARLRDRPNVWIGLEDRSTEGDWRWSDETRAGFFVWADGEPNNAGEEDCVEAGSVWNDLGCAQERPALCQQDGWSIRPTDGHAYLLFTQSLSWSEADAACRARGAHLVTLADGAERVLVRSMTGGGAHWIGLTDRDVEGSFRWVTGEPTDALAWASGEPNSAGDEDCVESLPDSTWNDRSCDERAPFVCEQE
jgi:cysteine-rich repeat protein